MFPYNKQISLDESNLPSLVSADTFEHLPPCPSRVIRPLCLIFPSEFDADIPKAAPPILRSDLDTLHWFFNLMQQACQCFEMSFEPGAFIRTSLEGPRYLTTRMFPQYRKDWLEHCLKFDRMAMTEVCLSLYDLVYAHEYDSKTASDEARILFALTGEFMEFIYRRITVEHDRHYGRPSAEYDWPIKLRGVYEWSSSVADILAGRFYDSGRCLYTYSRMSDLFNVQTVFYMSQLEGSENNKKHRKCTLDQCYGHNINPEEHRHIHVHPSCTCPLFEADLDTIADILETGDLIPVIVFDKGKDLKVRVVPDIEVECYIAISYVASQLFASPHTNSLPICQMRALRHIVRHCSQSLVQDGQVCGLWIDTLQVPVEAVRQVSRDQALLKMKKTMESATVVLVVDPSLAKRACTPFVPEEFMAAFVCSPWFSRLWTFSESQFAQNLWVWYAGVPYSVDQFLSDQNWPPSGLSWRSYDELETIGRLRLFSKTRIRPKQKSEDYFNVAMESLRHRQTSQPADEPFCLSMLMDLDTPGMLARPVEDRMEFFYRQVRNVSAVLLIQSGERLTNPGFRWAPKTFLGRKSVSRYVHEDDETIREDKLGILVPRFYFAFKLKIAGGFDDDQTLFKTSYVRRLCFYVNISDMYHTIPEEDANHPGRRLIIFETTEDVRFPIVRSKFWPFEVSSRELVMIHRGWLEDAAVGPSVLLEYEGEDESQQADDDSERTKPRILTRYSKLGGFHMIPKEDEDKLRLEYGLEAAFEGKEPVNEHRAAFDAEKIPLADIELWVS